MENANDGQAGVQAGAVKQTISNPATASGSNPSRQSAAFTLPELLTIIGVIVLLVLVWLPAHANMGRKAGILECKNNLRQVGMAIDMYTRDHQDKLPGPIWAGVFYSYCISDSGSMAHYLAPYFGLPAPTGYLQDVEALKCPASVQAQLHMSPSPPTFMPVCFISCTQLTNKPGPVPSDIVTYPFGRPNTPYTPTVQTARIKRPSEQWAMMDVEQQLLNYLGMIGATYYSYLPSLPVHNNRPGGPASPVLRNALYFDGTVRPVTSRY
jgi:type II secretory pathway pseudopilin PulG